MGALAIVVAVATFSRSLDRLQVSPDQWGARFDALLDPETDEPTLAGLLDDLRSDDQVDGVAVVADSNVVSSQPGGGDVVVARLAWAEAVKGVVYRYVVTDGEPLRGDGDACAGASPMARLELQLGDTLELPGENGARSFRVTGRAVTYGNDRIDDAIVVTARCGRGAG